MAANVETMAYREAGGMPWHREGVPVENDMTTDDMLTKAGLDWTVSKRKMYFPKVTEDGTTALRIVPEEFVLVRDSDESVLDTVGANYNPVQNRDVFDFFKRFVEAGDMQMETAGSLKGGKFIWALARINEGFKIGDVDETRGYLLLSQPHQFGFSLTAALTPVRVVCWNTLNYALGGGLNGEAGNNSARFRMVHSRIFDQDVKAEAERVLGLAHSSMKAFGHNAEMLAGTAANDDSIIAYFRDVLQLEQPEDDTEAAKAEAAEVENRSLKRFAEALLSAPGQDIKTARGTWWGSLQAVTYTIDHVMGRDENRLYNAWFGRGAGMKRRALDLAVNYAKAA